MSQRLQPILSLLDEGFLIYRRHFWRFVLIAAIWIIPTAIVVGLLINAVAWMNDSSIIPVVLLSMLLLLPLMLYILGSLSRAAHAAIAGQPVRIGQAIRIPIKQFIGMLGFILVYGVIMYLITSSVMMILICPLYIFALFGISLFSFASIGSSAVGGILFGLFFGIMYLISIAVSGAGYSSTVFMMQPWIAHRLSFGQGIQQCLDLASHGFRRNVGVWMLAALMAAALGLIITATISVIIPIPLMSWLTPESRIAQAGSLAAILLGMVVVLPPLPIWMALLYQRNLTIRAGAKLDAAIQEWANTNIGSGV